MSIQLNEVPAPADLRDLILAEWRAYRAWRGDGPPESLKSTFWAADKSGVPSHDRGRAIDVVTDDWRERGYLVEFALWLAVRRAHENINVILYRRDFQPHLHVADWSGRVGKPEPSIGVNLGVKGKYRYFLFPYSDKAEEIIKAAQDIKATYVESKEVSIDWDYWRHVLGGGEAVPSAGVSGVVVNAVSFFKKWWWFLLVPAVLIPLFFLFRKRGE
jgi:hypothetical protein